MRTLNIYIFVDGFKAYFFNGCSKQGHVMVKPGDVFDIYNISYIIKERNLKIKYSTWLKNLKCYNFYNI